MMERVLKDADDFRESAFWTADDIRRDTEEVRDQIAQAM